MYIQSLSSRKMQQQTPGGIDPSLPRTHSGIYLKKGHDWPRRDTTSPPVGVDRLFSL